ncbi:hypothetical protein GIB67_007839 [Kingdonia uniflora]|uniref:Uncharacterized protein n=1 Tax=Kingdonia uniflora TaxID=39325 RepID=A0A7J7N2Q1_9MAGN|nr:hypothetical protein GIB67_007839 [Kingdonia uniflora]
MVKTRSMVLEERIASKIWRLKLKYFGDPSLEMFIPAPVPPMYLGLSNHEAIKAEEEFYCKSGPFHFYQLFGGGSFRGGGGISGGGRGIDESISLDYFDGDVRSDLPEDFLYYLSQLENGLSLFLTNLAKGIMNAIGACPIQLNGNMWEFYGVKNYKANGGSYICASATRRRFFDLNLVGRTWNDNVIWVKGNCLLRDDEEPLDLQFRTVKQSVKSLVKRKESLLDEVAEEAELKFVLEGLGLSRKRRVDSRSKMVQKAQSTWSMVGTEDGKKQATGGEGQTNLAKTPGIDISVQPKPFKSSKIAQKYPKKWMLKALLTSGTTGSGKVAKEKMRRVEPSGESGDKVIEGQSAAVDDLKEVKEWARLAALHGEEDTSKMVSLLVKGIRLGIEEEKFELMKEKIELEKKLARVRTDALKKAEQLGALKSSHAVAISQLQVEARANLDKMVEERDRLRGHLMVKGYYEEEVNAIKADTYVEEGDDEEVEVVGVMDVLDGVSHQTVLDNQGDDTELPEGDNEKALREMSLKIKDLETGLAREIKISSALLSAQAKLQVELDSARSCEDDVLECNREFIEELDRMREANENREDQHVKVHFKLVEVTQADSDLNHKVEEKDAEIGKGMKELAEMTEHTAKLQIRVDALMGHVQRGNVHLRECQQKLDVALIREKALEGEIKAKETLMKRKEELLKEILAREELSAEIERLRAQVVDLGALNLAESAKYIIFLEENAVHDARVDR